MIELQFYLVAYYCVICTKFALKNFSIDLYTIELKHAKIGL